MLIARRRPWEVPDAGLCLRLIALSSVAMLALGCAQDCKQSDETPVEYQGGSVDASGTFYETSAWDGGFLHFPAGRSYRIFHRLDARPIDVNTYLSFAESALGTGHNVSESAGNQAVIDAVTDEHVEVRNDTCAEFWLRVTAQAPLVPLADAGSD